MITTINEFRKFNENNSGGWLNTTVYRKSDQKEFTVYDFKNYGSYQEIFLISKDNEKTNATLGHPLNKEEDFMTNFKINK